VLSVLIPVYNNDVTELVTELKNQCNKAKIIYELIVADDASDKEFLEQYDRIGQYPNVKIIRLKENQGRSKIRNFLAAEAGGAHLLFLDCDAKVVQANFIEHYLEKKGDHSVVCGGTLYQEDQVDTEYTLHWVYGKNREQKDAAHRQSKAYASFKTFNFLIPKSLFIDIQLNESIKGYGHEDTLFGLKLKEKNIPVVHIDNPLMHMGIEKTEVFLSKTKTALYNLAILHSKGEVGKDIKLIRYYLYAKKSRIIPLVLKRFNKQKESILTQLRGNYPSLRKFDFYRLGKFIQYMNELEA
jgi:glycosyltransferase involved in cell wall biosynthesis